MGPTQVLFVILIIAFVCLNGMELKRRVEEEELDIHLKSQITNYAKWKCDALVGEITFEQVNERVCGWNEVLKHRFENIFDLFFYDKHEEIVKRWQNELTAECFISCFEQFAENDGFATAKDEFDGIYQCGPFPWQRDSINNLITHRFDQAGQKVDDAVIQKATNRVCSAYPRGFEKYMTERKYFANRCDDKTDCL